LGGLVRWLLEPLDPNRGPVLRDVLLKCRICGTELNGEEQICPVCGFAISVAPENPENLETLQNDARNPRSAGNLNESPDRIDRPEDLNPSRAEGWYVTALDECRHGQYEEAIVSLQKACQLDGLYASLANTEHDFKPLRTDLRFHELLQKRSEALKETPNPEYYSTNLIGS
jgi:tetratricopeptide (TPR) repeat protein